MEWEAWKGFAGRVSKLAGEKGQFGSIFVASVVHFGSVFSSLEWMLSLENIFTIICSNLS